MAIDTSDDKIYAIVNFINHNKKWEGLQEIDVVAYEESAQLLLALLEERKALQSKIELYAKDML